MPALWHRTRANIQSAADAQQGAGGKPCSIRPISRPSCWRALLKLCSYHVGCCTAAAGNTAGSSSSRCQQHSRCSSSSTPAAAAAKEAGGVVGWGFSSNLCGVGAGHTYEHPLHHEPGSVRHGRADGWGGQPSDAACCCSCISRPWCWCSCYGGGRPMQLCLQL